MADINSPDFNPGGIPDRVDHRDHQWSEVGFGSSSFDWSVGYDGEKEVANAIGNPSFKFPVKDQDGSGSCGGQAWAYYAAALEALATKTFEERSAKFIYSQTYVPGGGSYGRDNCDVFVKQGVAREGVLVSYELGAPPSEAFMERSVDITEDVRKDAALSKASSYANVPSVIDAIAQAMRDNNGLVLGVHGQNNGTWTSTYPKPPTAREWGHWIYACKARMVDGVKQIGFINSWGSGIGEGGWQWLTEDWFTKTIDGYPVIFSVWTQVFNPTPIPPTFHHVFNTDLQLYMSGSEVVALQKALQLDGTFPISVPPTGYYGNITKTAVTKFQVKYAITPSIGRCGPKTRAKLNELYGK